jgi:hypothetical protein
MSDIRKALEAAAEAVYNARPYDPAWEKVPNGYRWPFNKDARAAVLAFLRAMPDWESVTGPATDPIETPKYYRMAVLIDDIEQETQA